MAWYAPNWLTGLDEENLERANAADRKNRERNAELAARGAYDAGTYAAVQERDRADDTTANQARLDTSDAFVEGLSDGYNNVTRTINKGLAAPFKFAFASIPWFYWIIGAGVLFWYVGGAFKIRNLLKR